MRTAESIAITGPVSDLTMSRKLKGFERKDTQEGNLGTCMHGDPGGQLI
jgi:hypothetical protein